MSSSQPALCEGPADSCPVFGRHSSRLRASSSASGSVVGVTEREDGPDESAIRESWEGGRFEQAAVATLERYGPEVLGFLYATARPPLDPDELFSSLCERLWTHLPSFRWQSSLRTWLYVVARNLVRAAHRSSRGPSGRVALTSDFSDVAARVRSSTPAYMRTAEKTRLQEIRDALEPDDRMLLILRVDRKMAWNDIATVLSQDVDDRSLAQRSAALRKRFERLKERLRKEMRAPS